ncbi:MAG: hypothetical protein IJ958_07235 [Agathobacter sp.]|nr:hypothetical protein [Agathobacter sp.]
MNSKVTRVIVLVVVFISAIITFSFLENKVNKDVTMTMEEASLPVMQFVYNDTVLNELHGYTKEMDMLSMRDGLMPIGEDRVLDLEIMTYGKKIDNLSYKIRSMDSERLLVDVETADIISSQDKVECQVNLPSLFEDNMEYNMELVVTMGEEKVYYYTRVVKAADCYVDETLDFALQFHEYTFRDDAGSFIPTYMDPATGDATNLAYVDLSCTLGQITWGKFEGVKLTEPVVSFKEIHPSYNVITLNYVMTNVNENNEVEYYNVEEYYRLRQTTTRIYVLNFERTMNQIFRSENDFLLGTAAIQLGIRNKDVEFLANDSGDVISFVQEGELWSYDRINNSIAQVFSFRGVEGINNRENWDQHDIKIVRVDEAGSISFLVYGYMNRGLHEGKVGVGVYYYDALNQTVEEEVFIETDKSYEVLKAELGKLMYVNEQKQFFFLLNNCAYEINLTNFELKTLVEADDRACYAVSESGRYLAWIAQEQLNSSPSIMLQDLKMGITHYITSGTDTYLKPITFIGEDFVYGVANIADVKEDAVGNLVFPMSSVEILNTSEEKLEVIKTYRPQSGKIGEISVDANNVYMQLVENTEGRYVEIGEDTIMNREAAPANGVSVAITKSEIKQTQVSLTMKDIGKAEDSQIVLPKHIKVEENRTVAFDLDTENYYYVYVKGEVLLATKDAAEAIRMANANYGVVVDSDVNYVFKRARNTTQTALGNLSPNEADVNASSMIKCVSIMLKKEGAGIGVTDLVGAGQTPIEIVTSTFKDYRVLELNGCKIDDLLYFIDQGTPVLAKTGADQAILLTGYSSNYIYYYEPSSGQTKTIGYTEIESLFYQGGNYFIAYVK